MTATADPLVASLDGLDEHLGALLTPAFCRDELRAMTDAATLALTRTLEALGRRIDAARLMAAAEIDDRSRPERGEARLSTRSGCAGAAELLCRLTGVTLTTAKDRIRAGRAIATTTALSGESLPAAFPSLRNATDAGTVGLDTIIAITRTLGPIADRCHPGELAAAEQELVDAALGARDALPCGADETRIQAKVWSLVLDPDGVLPEYERAMRRRTLVLGRERDGLVPLRGELLPDVAAQLGRLFDANLSPRIEDPALRALPPSPSFRPSPGADGDERADAAAVTAPDPRSLAQKQHDALASILGVAARSAETPSLGGAAPTLLVTVAAADLLSPAGVAHIDGTDTALPASVARHVACAGGIQRLVLGDSGRILELGGPQRVFSAPQRRAITARDGGCVIPGCGIKAAWCEIHHVVAHARAGPTHIDNGVTLCWHHHRTLETSGWAVRVTEGVPEVRAPAWIDSAARWRAVRRSPHLEAQRLKRRRDTG